MKFTNVTVTNTKDIGNGFTITDSGYWQPIETAPKDGTLVDLCGLNWLGEPERWCAARWEPDYDEDENGWKGPWSDGYDSRIPSRTDGYDRFMPTHWMLPPPLPVNGEAPL